MSHASVAHNLPLLDMLQLQENEKQFTITVKPGVFSLVGSLALYTETFNKDGSINEWRGARRDLNIGRSFGQMYMTDDNRLVLRYDSGLYDDVAG